MWAVGTYYHKIQYRESYQELDLGGTIVTPQNGKHRYYPGHNTMRGRALCFAVLNKVPT